MEREGEWLLKEKYNGEKTAGFFTDLKRLVSGEPVGYVIGHIPFLDCRIYLDSHPLIPRPETEFWVEKAIEAIKEAAGSMDRPLRILDLCAGSGAIGVAVAKAIPSAEVTFADIDHAHSLTILKNLSFNLPDYSNRMEYFNVVESDLFSNIEGKFDFILTNPPYIDPALDRTEASVKNFEPHLALYGGDNGMELIERIIAAAPEYISDNGQLWIEHEPEQSELISKQASDRSCLPAGRSMPAHTFPDQYGAQRYSVLNL